MIIKRNSAEAVLFDGRNLEEIHDLLGTGASETVTPWLYSPIEKRYAMLRETQWVVALNTGTSIVLDEDVFDLIYGDFEPCGIDQEINISQQHMDNARVTFLKAHLVHGSRVTKSRYKALGTMINTIVKVSGNTIEELEEKALRAGSEIFGEEAVLGLVEEYYVHLVAEQRLYWPDALAEGHRLGATIVVFKA